ncbi:MAG TPA: hypothetical protein VNL39_14465 [Xanthobacteraceae bacterium]|nr:hypothetical protein [Xanthobacteraceae bacterium]
MHDTMLRPTLLRQILKRILACAALIGPCAAALAEPPTDGVPGAAMVPLAPDVKATLSEILNFDPFRSTGTSIAPNSLLRVRPPNAGPFDWNRVEKQDGSTSVSVKKELPTAWDAKLGADFGFGAPADPSRQPLPSPKEPNSGAAWAKIRVPGVAMVDARVEPSPEQQKFATTVSRSLPLGSSYSLTLQNSFTMTDHANASPAPVAGGPTVTTTPAQAWSTDRMVKFSILPTGTSVAAGTTSSSTDNVTRSKISAEQKLFEHFNVTTSVTDVGAPSSNKSITAGFKWQW